MKRNRFEYDIKKIKRDRGLSETYEVDVSLFLGCTSNITSLNSIMVNVDFFTSNDSVILNGTITAMATTLCSRCCEKIEIKMSEDFEHVYDTFEPVDIKPLIDEAITLSEPLKSICQKNSCVGEHVENLDLKRFRIKEGENYAKSKKKTH